ncbi:hypothetical protein YC2023_058892 [Brassica napus]
MKSCLRTPFEDQAERSSIGRAGQEIELPRRYSDDYGAFRSLNEISSELTIRGRYEGETIDRCTSSVVDRYIRDASTIEYYDRSIYIMSVVSGLLALLKVERDKIGAAPYDGCLRTLVEGIKPFVVRLGVKFSAVCKLAGFLKTLEYWQRDKFWDLVSRFLILCLEMLETSVLVLEGAMTNSTYVSRFSFILIPYRFKVRDRFSAYTTCMVGTEHLSKDNF